MRLGEWPESCSNRSSRCRVERTLDIKPAIAAIGEPEVALLGGPALLVRDPLRVGTMPLMHRVVPKLTHAALLRRFQEWCFVERLSALRVSDRLAMPRDDGGVGKADAALPDRFHGPGKVRQLLTYV